MTPLIGLLACLAGMAAGLVIDCAATPPAVLASLCALPGSILANLRAHWAVMPATHLVMITGWLLAAAAAAGNEWRRTEVQWRKTIAVRLCTDTVCLAGMLGGMIAGSALGPLLIAGVGLRPNLAGLTVAMAAGMAGGMAMALPLARTVTGRPGHERLRRVPVDEAAAVWQVWPPPPRASAILPSRSTEVT